MSRSAFSQFLSRPAPCDSCEQQTRCQLSETSCRDFSVFVVENRIVREQRQPTRRRFQKLMGEV
jgi:hypothetical protein